MISREVYFKNPESVEHFPDEIPEVFNFHKSEIKSIYSTPFPTYSLDELQAIHNSGWVENEQFIYEELDQNNRVVRRIFNEKGQLAESITFDDKTNLKDATHDPNSVLKKTTLIYDRHDYLEGVIELNSSDLDPQNIHPTQIGKPAGSVMQILYGVHPVEWKPKKGTPQTVQLRLPDFIVIREVLTNPGDPTLSRPGHPWSFGKALRLDLTGFPYEQPKELSDPPIFPFITS